MNGLNHFKLVSQTFANKDGIRMIDPDKKEEGKKEEKEEKKEEQELQAKKEEKQEKEENEEKQGELTDDEVITQAKEKAEEILKVPEDKRSKEDKAFLETYESLEKKEEESSTGYSDLIADLESNQILSRLEDKEYEDSREGFIDLLNDNRELAVEDYKNNLPDSAKQLLSFVESGGDVNDYIEAVSGPDYSSVDLSVESNQRLMVAENLARQGYSEKDIENKLEVYKDNGMLESEAKISQNTLVKTHEQKQKEILNAQEDLKKQRQEAISAKVKEYNSKLDGLDKIDDIPVSKKDATSLKVYMTRPVKDGKTQWQLDSSSIDNQIKQAFFTMKKFNMSNIGKNVKSKAVADIRKILNNIGDRQTKSVDSGVRSPSTTEVEKEGKISIPVGPWDVGK